jgi:hypothetical protein
MSGADRMRETRYTELSKHFGTALLETNSSLEAEFGTGSHFVSGVIQGVIASRFGIH